MGIVESESTFASPGRELPALRPGLLDRRRLVRRLLSSVAPLLLVTGPAGYGKTTLLLQYVRRDPRHTEWLCLDKSDNDPFLLLERLSDCVAAFAPPDPVHSAAAFRNGREGPAWSSLIRQLAGSRQPFTLVLDDVHELSSPASLDILAAISMSVPPGSRVVLGSRTTPDIGIGGLRALGHVLEIGAIDLALTAREAADILSGEGVGVGDDDLDRLMHATEGWATGLYLAARSLRSGESRASDFSGDDPLITDYLWDEALKSVPEPTIEFLIHSSVLDRLTGPMCDAVLGRKGSGVLLRELHRANLFMIPLDRHQHAYRYHRLFAEALRAELNRRDPGLAAELHLRASSWYQSQGNPDDAIGHATVAGDIRRASELIWAQISPMASPSTETLERWLSPFSERDAGANPPAALAKAWLHAEQGDGDGTDRWISVAERGYYRGHLPGGPGNLAAAVSLMRARLGRDGIARMTRDASHAYNLEANHGPWKGVARYLEGMGLRLLGDRESAREALKESERRCRCSVPYTHAGCLAQLALIAVEEGDGDHSRDLSGRVVELVDELHRRSQAVPAIVYAVSALALAQKGDHLTAKAHLQGAASVLARSNHFAPWLDAECRIVMARANLALADGVAAQQLLADARLSLHDIPDAVLLNTWMDEVGRAVKEFPLPSHDGGPSLTTAELRVLNLLPTHLSFPDIGTRLCVSRNTVKSQAMSVYRKLGVGSRADAVKRAGSLGLLDGIA
jgi:LuxR family transcriptional regulator, maltose regulon positive regulatory protein